jgi:hypothetical protein
MRRRFAVVGAGGAVAAVIVAAFVAGTRSPEASFSERAMVLGKRAGLPALPAGEPAVDGGDGSVERVDLEAMTDRSPVIFVGRALDRGGSEEVTPADAVEPGVPALTAHRIRFEIKKMYRGDDAPALDVTVLDIDPDFDEFELGAKYLVFAEWRELGTKAVRALVPTGYYQGSYKFTSENADTATNETNGTVDVRKLEERVKTKGEK